MKRSLTEYMRVENTPEGDTKNQIFHDQDIEIQPLGKYGQMALNHLKLNQPLIFSQTQLDGTLMRLMHQVDEAAHDRMEMLQEDMLKVDPVKKPEDTYESYRHRMMIRDRAEEVVLQEIIFVEDLPVTKLETRIAELNAMREQIINNRREPGRPDQREEDLIISALKLAKTNKSSDCSAGDTK